MIFFFKANITKKLSELYASPSQTALRRNHYKLIRKWVNEPIDQVEVKELMTYFGIEK